MSDHSASSGLKPPPTHRIKTVEEKKNILKLAISKIITFFIMSGWGILNFQIRKQEEEDPSEKKGRNHALISTTVPESVAT